MKQDYLNFANASSLARILSGCEELRSFSSGPDAYTRLYLSQEHRNAADWISSIMKDAGMTVREDAVGNIIGRYEAAQLESRAVVLGSHFDTVPNGGNYDGIVGIMIAIECVASLNEEGRRLPFAIEVYAFADEEGARFTTGFLTSSTVAEGVINFPFNRLDADGISLSQALHAFGLDPEKVGEAKRQKNEFLAFIELHIEQGPVLENQDLPICPVTSINGQTRMQISVSGQAGHAGTVPMLMRRDALAGAAQMICGVEEICKGNKSLVGTVGTLTLTPGVLNVIPGEVVFGIDLRSEVDEIRQSATNSLLARFESIAEERKLRLSNKVMQTTPAVECDPALVDIISQACLELTGSPLTLNSGAGHDAAIMSQICPAGMIFIRCKNGISHHPAESISESDVKVAYLALKDVLERLAKDWITEYSSGQLD